MENIISTKTIYQPDSAIFIDNEQSTINVQVIEQFTVKDWSGKEYPKENIFTRTIKVEPSEVLTEFLSQVELDKVSENTLKNNEYIEEQNKELENKIKKDILNEINDKPAATSQKIEFDLSNLSEDDLFKLKLQSFEIEQIKNSKNRELKAAIRKSKTFLEVVAYTTAVILDK